MSPWLDGRARRVLVTTALALACTRSPTRRALPVPADAPPSLDEALSRYTVDNARPWHRVLYSWTPPERAAALVRDGVLLTVGPLGGGSLSPFSALLFRLRGAPGTTGTIAHALLYDAPLNRYRYAWTNPYGTALGFQGRSYGTSLVRMVLRDDALVLRLDPSDPQPFRLFDRDQRELPIERFRAEAPRVAAVFHVRTGRDVAAPFREYVVCNAEAIASWSVASREACAELAAEHALLTRLALSPAPLEGLVTDRWTQLAGAPSLGERWASTMATAASHYRPTPANLGAVAEAIRACDTSATRE